MKKGLLVLNELMNRGQTLQSARRMADKKDGGQALQSAIKTADKKDGG